MIGRITQRMMIDNSITAIQGNLGKMAKTQEQMSTGKLLNRPSDSPTDTTAAMRLRDSLAASAQYTRNADDGLGWLSQADTTLGSVGNDVQKAYTLALQGANTGAMGPAALGALADEVDGLRADLLASSNSTYLGRPIFGGVTSGAQAYDDTGAYVGTPGAVNRRIADGVSVRVDVDGRDVFGEGSTSVFAELGNLSAALRSGDAAGITSGIQQMQARIDTVTSARTAAGVVYHQIDHAKSAAADAQLQMTDNLSSLEDLDLPKATIDLQMQQVAYQASLAATSKTVQPSLLDFLH